jgi:heme-degrading monooxygenase HmoA
VILRVIRGRGSTDEVAALSVALAARAGAAPDHQGPQRFHLGWRPATDTDRQVVVISHWASAEAAARGDANETSPLAVARRHVREVEVAHFEVDDTIRRASVDEPMAIRIATGRFSRPGADSEMQNLLRERAPLIGDEMAEAWVGRRITGRAIEVTFVSTWRRAPADRALDDAFWPDIALRYDQFVVEVYSAVSVE